MEASGAAAVGDGTRGELDLRRVRERVLAKGFTADQFEQAIDEYSLLDVSITVQCSRRLTVLMLLDRSGKQLEKAQGLSLSRLGWRMRIWMLITTSRAWDWNVGIGCSSVCLRRTKALDIRTTLSARLLCLQLFVASHRNSNEATTNQCFFDCCLLNVACARVAVTCQGSRLQASIIGAW